MTFKGTHLTEIFFVKSLRLFFLRNYFLLDSRTFITVSKKYIICPYIIKNGLKESNEF